MEMFFSQQTAPRPLQQTPLWLVYSNEFLGLSALDLQTRLHEEAQVNPALEVEERPICATCGRALRGPLCRYCLPSSVAVAPNSGSSFEPDESAGFVRGSARDEADLDPLAHYAAPMELREALALALQAELPSEAAPIIEYLVGNLDEEGYLRCTVEETAQVVNVPVSQVEQVLAHLHAQEPSGIGARDVRECLLLQLRHLAAQGCEQPDALAIVTHFLHELAQRKYAFIAKQLGMSHKQVEEAHAFIKTRLTPFPASSAVDHAAHVEASPPQVVTPQVVIRRQRVRDGSPYSVEIVEAEQFQVRMNPAYSEAYRELRSQHTICHESERTHLRHYMNHAHLVISSLQRRWQTLRRITCCLVKRQERFLERGNVALLPLTRAEVAEELGLHPSTISRAVADKYVLLPVGATISFDTFFLANLSVKAALKELLDHESSPRSDQRLAELLAAQGIQIARRTVAKYREELRIPDSSRR